jgi:hypothetical protein
MGGLGALWIALLCANNDQGRPLIGASRIVFNQKNLCMIELPGYDIFCCGYIRESDAIRPNGPSDWPRHTQILV